MSVSIKTLSLVGVLCAFYACSSATSSNNNTTTNNNSSASTTKMVIDVPKSLTPSSSPNSSSSAPSVNVGWKPSLSAGGQPSLSAAPPTTAQPSVAYLEVYTTMQLVKAMGGVVGQFGSLAATVVSQNNLSPSGSTVSGKKITITQTLLDAMKASVPDGMADESHYPAVGDSLPFPDFVYNTTSASGYNFSFAIADIGNGAGSLTVYWSADKKKVALVMSMSMSGQSLSMKLATDTATSSTALSLTSGTSTFDVSFKTDTASTTGGVFIKIVAGSTTVSGYGDNNGGTVVQSGATPYIESFNASGTQVYFSHGSTTYDAGGGELNTDKLNNTDYGNAASQLPTS